jgi:hypothetical protein
MQIRPLGSDCMYHLEALEYDGRILLIFIQGKVQGATARLWDVGALE